ncbi:ead/Ea22-like family protein [Cronobacter malonaticus]
MTDTAKLKAAAERQKSILEYIASFEPADIDSDTVDLRFEDENGCDTGCDVSIVEECRRSADLVGELIAALEAALAECRENAARIAGLESQRKLAFAACNRWADKCREAERRAAGLEAREIKPANREVLVTVSGYTGCGKSAIAGEIEIAMRAIGVPVEWAGGDAEKRMTGADWLTAIEMYKPNVKIIEVNVPRAAAGINLETGGE